MGTFVKKNKLIIVPIDLKIYKINRNNVLVIG